MDLAPCKPSGLQGSAILGENTFSKVAFSAGSGHTFCSVVRVRRVDQRRPSRLLQGAGTVSWASSCWLCPCCWWAAGLQYKPRWTGGSVPTPWGSAGSLCQ